MKRRIAIIGGIVVVIGMLVGFGWHFFGDKIGGSGTAGEDVVYVSTVSSLTETAFGTQNRYAGVVEPQETVKVSLDSKRVVKDVKVTEGQQVTVGTPLFEYDESASRDDLQQAQLELEQLQNDVLSLQDQLKTLEEEKKTAASDNQLSYTIQIQQTKMDIKKNEYSQKSKTKEIEKLQSAAVNTVITSEIDGVIKSIDTSKMNQDSDVSPGDMDMMDGGDGDENAFITILGTGSYRVKGSINEQNAQSITQGAPVLIRSRVDEKQIWKGTMGAVDFEKPNQSSNNGMYYGYGMTSDQENTSSSTYPFYVELESADGLMLGQHVYIEMDYGQEEEKEGIWLDSFYLVDLDSDPYVWMANDRDKLVKQKVKIGGYDENLDKYEVLSGIDMESCLAYPTDALEEGLPTEINDGVQIPYTGKVDEKAEGMEEIPEEELDDSPMIEDGPEEGELRQEDMEMIEASPDGPFSEEIIVEDSTVQEGVGPR